MAVGETLLSRIIDANDPTALTRLGIEREHFPTETERRVFDFIRTYSEQNRGQAPSYATVVGEFPTFVYTPGVTDSYEYLARKLKDSAGKRSFAALMNEEVPKLFASHESESLILELQKRLEGIRIGLRTNVPIGTNVTTDTDKFLAEYRARKEGKSFRIWRSKFPSINRAIGGGGYFSSNMYTWYARSGRGKSVITMEEALEAAFQGATVLVWALEMGAFEWMARAYSSMSARQGIVTAQIDGVNYDAGFESRALLSGRLTDDYERGFEMFVSTLAETLPGRIIVRAVDDADFRDRSLRQLEADIIETKADVVVIDPIYYMDFEANTSKTAGGDVAATSKGLRKLAGATKTVIHVITQADEDAKEKNDDGTRDLNPPKRAEIKKTKAVLEDAANVFGIDTLAQEGRGIIEIGKGRNGGEDERIELLYLPNYGIVREMEVGEVFAEQFI